MIIRHSFGKKTTSHTPFLSNQTFRKSFAKSVATSSLQDWMQFEKGGRWLAVVSPATQAKEKWGEGL